MSLAKEKPHPPPPKHTHTQKNAPRAISAGKKKVENLCAPPPGNFCAVPRLKLQFRSCIGPGCGCRGGLGRGWVECWGARRDVDRWLPRRAGARAALGRLALIPFRKLLHRSPVKVAVQATNRARLRLPGGWAVGGALGRWWTSSSGQHVETCTGGRRGCVCARASTQKTVSWGSEHVHLFIPPPCYCAVLARLRRWTRFLAAGAPRVPDSGAPIRHRHRPASTRAWLGACA